MRIAATSCSRSSTRSFRRYARRALPPLEEREHVARVRVLAEHDDADLRIRLAQSLGGLDPLVGVARRHADVGDDDIRPLSVDRGEQRVEIAADGRDLEVGMRLEQAPDALTDEVVVLGEHEPDRRMAEDTPVTPLVLIVDDNEKNLKLARDVLRAAGFRTLEAATAPRGSRSRPSICRT